jgi:RNA polymerase sigma-70 factor (ECF subfamily)
MVDGWPQSGLRLGRRAAWMHYLYLLFPGCKECPAAPVFSSMGSAHELGRLRPQLMSFALRRLGDRHRAEDAVQETLLAALEGINRFGGGSSLRTWLTGILKHKIVDALRAAPPEEPLDYHEEVHDAHPETELAQRRILEAVDARLKELSANAARVFVLRDVLGMDTAEVCRELSISRANCWVMSHRARVRLRALAADAL